MNISEFFNVNLIDLWLVVAVSVFNAVLLCFVGYKFLQIIQLTGYRLKGFFAYLRDTKFLYLSRLIFLSVLSFASMITINILCDGLRLSRYFYFLGMIIYFAFSVVFVIKMWMWQNKAPLKYTTRMTRLTTVLLICSGIVSFGIITAGYLVPWSIGPLFISLTPISLLITVPISYFVLQPIEYFIKREYLNKAKKKLKLMPNLIKIGITGSFGKTSTKFILNTILKTKFKVCASPASFNTLMGITKVINNHLNTDDEILICEMGARKTGDIRELCKVVNPKIGILTAVAPQHIETFKSVEAIAKTKYELVEGLAQGGFMVFNGENNGALELFKKAKTEKYKTGFNAKNELYAEDIKTSIEGTGFTLNYNGEKVSANCRLLGKHNIENILTAGLVALKLGVSLTEIGEAVKTIKPVPHRLELIKSDNGVIILDDSYNSNVESSKKALEILKDFESKNKWVLTPGLVEMGKVQAEVNFEFGKNIAGVANFVIIVNKTNRKAIKEGLISGGFNAEGIYYAENLEVAKKIMSDNLKPGDALLIENDLPDNYA